MTGNPYDMSGPEGYGPVDGAEGMQGPAAEAQAPAGRQEAGTYRAQMTRANVMLALLFIGGAAGVYALSLREGPAEASAEQQLAEAQVDSAIERFSQRPSGSSRPTAGRMTRELLRDFYSEIRQRQIPLKGLKKDPFLFVRPAGEALPSAAEEAKRPAGGPREDARPEESLEEAQARFETLQLRSIMMGRGGGTAIISNNLVTVGQKIDWFTVESITPKSVVLVWQDRRFTLEMP